MLSSPMTKPGIGSNSYWARARFTALITPPQLSDRPIPSSSCNSERRRSLSNWLILVPTTTTVKSLDILKTTELGPQNSASHTLHSWNQLSNSCDIQLGEQLLYSRLQNAVWRCQ